MSSRSYFDLVAQDWDHHRWMAGAGLASVTVDSVGETCCAQSRCGFEQASIAFSSRRGESDAGGKRGEGYRLVRKAASPGSEAQIPLRAAEEDEMERKG